MGGGCVDQARTADMPTSIQVRADGHLDGVAAVHRESRGDGYSENTFIQT